MTGIETKKSGTGRGHPIDEFDEALRLYKNCLSCTRHYLEEPNCIPELVLYNADPDDVNYKCGKFLAACLWWIYHKQEIQTRRANLYFCVFWCFVFEISGNEFLFFYLKSLQMSGLPKHDL